MRKKETVSQYMFIPEPDLPVIELNDDYINKIASDLPERPEAKIEKFTKLGIPVDDATIISAEVELAHLFEKVAKEINHTDHKAVIQGGLSILQDLRARNIILGTQTSKA